MTSSTFHSTVRHAAGFFEITAVGFSCAVNLQGGMLSYRRADYGH